MGERGDQSRTGTREAGVDKHSIPLPSVWLLGHVGGIQASEGSHVGGVAPPTS